MYRFIVVVILLLTSLMAMAFADAYDFDKIYNKFCDTDSKSLSDMGRKCISRQSTDSAMALFTILANRYDGNEKNPAEKKYAIEARLSLGVLNFLSANYTAAYSNFLTASQLEGKIDSPGNLNLASIYLFYGNKEKAYKCLRRVFDAAIASRNNYMASAALINILTANFDNRIVPEDSMKSILNNFAKKVPRTSDNRAWPLAHCYAEAKKFVLAKQEAKAIDMLKASLDSAKYMLLPQRARFASYSAIGKLYLNAGRTDSAEFFFHKAEDIARDNGFPELLISVYSNLSDLYYHTGNRELADKYKFKHLELHDSIFNAREFGHIHDLELFHETDKFEKRLNQIKLEEKLQSRITIITSICLCLLALMLIVLFRQNKNLRLKNKSLFDRNIEIMDSGNTAARSSDTEKKISGPAPDADTRKHIYECIQQAMSDESVFCSDGFSMRELTELCNSNQKYVSLVLNEDFGKSFTQLLNERRINVARRRLLDTDKYGHLTIEAIVSDLGFRSRSTFSKTFKRMTGLSPSEFQRMAAESKEKQQ